MTIKSFAELNKYLTQFVPSLISDPGVYTLDRMKEIMPIIGSPQEKVKVVHVAGTSGKTSTSYYISSMLSKTGSKVGLCVSPHIYEVNERVQINNVPLEENEFCRLFSEFIDIPGVITLKPSYFELLVAFAYWVFYKLGCDYVVMEVGLGGLIDGTNVIDNPEKIAVITDIGLDHTRILGETLREIAHQKAGIICSGNTVFVNSQSTEVMTVVKAQSHKVGASISVIDEEILRNSNKFIADLPNYQKRNWLLAKQVFDYIGKRDSLEKLSDKLLLETQQLQVPARMQLVQRDDRKILLDGAHNPQKLRALVDSIKLLYPKKRIALLVSFGAAKEDSLDANLQILHELTRELIVTSFELREDFAHKSVELEKIAKKAHKLGFDVIVEPNNGKAFSRLCEKEADLYLITGSFYLISAMYDMVTS